VAVQSKLHVPKHRARKSLHARELWFPTTTTLQPHLQAARSHLLANLIAAASFCCAAFAANMGDGGFCSHLIRLGGFAAASCDLRRGSPVRSRLQQLRRRARRQAGQAFRRRFRCKLHGGGNLGDEFPACRYYLGSWRGRPSARQTSTCFPLLLASRIVMDRPLPSHCIDVIYAREIIWTTKLSTLRDASSTNAMRLHGNVSTDDRSTCAWQGRTRKHQSYGRLI
jgi:hypothetical protein